MEVTSFKQDSPCITIKNHGCEIYFVRHGQSLANIGNCTVDSPLSEVGLEQVQKNSGHFNLVLCSPLRRTKETLHHSNITYDSLIIEHKIREMIQDKTSALLLEKYKPETLEHFWERANKFTQELEHHCVTLSTNCTDDSNPKILIVGHGFFFNGWYRRGSYPAPTNGHLFRIV